MSNDVVTTPAPRSMRAVPKTLQDIDGGLLRPFSEIAAVVDQPWWLDAMRGTNTNPDGASAVMSVARAALEAGPNRNQNLILIALMLGGFPTKAHDPATYQDRLTHEAMRFPPSVVAAACQAIVETRRFPPAVSEFLDECEAQRTRLAGAVQVLARVA